MLSFHPSDMKHCFVYFLSAISAFGFLPVLAQPVLNCSIQFGDIAISSNNDSIFEGMAGENVVWDFSDLEVDPFNFYEILDPSLTPYSADFPEADYVMFDYNNYYDYYQCDEERHSALGNSFNQLSDPQDLLRFPMTYLDEFVDTYVSEEKWGTDSILADGYGTLILPYGTFDNVLRVRDINNYSTPFLSTTVREEHYRYFAESSFAPILQVKHRRVGLALVHGVIFMDPDAVSVENRRMRSGLSVYPNPAASFVNFNGIERNSTINVFSISGSIVMSVTSDEKINTLDVNSLCDGFYLVEITDDYATRVLPLQVIH